MGDYSDMPSNDKNKQIFDQTKPLFEFIAGSIGVK